MAFFHSSERRKAAAFIDARMSEAEAMLTDPSLGRVDTLSLKTLQRLVPVFLDKTGVAPLPKQAQKEDLLIPIAVVKPRQTVLLDQAYNRMNKQQAHMLARTARGWKPRNDVVAGAASALSERPRWQYTVGANVAGFVLSQVAAFGVDSDHMGKSPVRTMRGRPFIGLVDDDSLAASHPTLTFHHEIQHAIQMQYEPVGNNDLAKATRATRSAELEAYVSTGLLAKQLYYDSQNPAFRGNKSLIDTNMAVATVWEENVEIKKSHSDIWEPQGRILKALEAAQLTMIQ